MAKRRKPNFQDLVKENRKQILSDHELINKIETKIDERHHQKLRSS
ncbi:Fur-regulated basic protein B [Thalassobacillus cyri]|uniref:Fur-regulated basic protein B n=1 Tax=Thalassobacillus cyri TaxID=571932 RepID=A0A1H4GX28_9BACI|nr:FbpB family small basic protein [Thalassobacillus cyri]SEB14117.1 Fur-regulated basic protein B [Thalassobacillus cyri]